MNNEQIISQVCFFHTGNDTTVPNMMLQSLLLAYQDHPISPKVIQVSDKKTPRAEGITDLICVKTTTTSKIMQERIEAYAKVATQINGPVAYIDTDMLFVGPIRVPIHPGKWPVLCRRSFYRDELPTTKIPTPSGPVEFPEHKDKTIDKLYPILGCFAVSDGPGLWNDCHQRYSNLTENYKSWYGDQLVLAEVAREKNNILVDEWTHACLPEMTSQVDRSQVIAMHYKGSRKKNMSKHLSMLMNLS